MDESGSSDRSPRLCVAASLRRCVAASLRLAGTFVSRAHSLIAQRLFAFLLAFLSTGPVRGAWWIVCASRMVCGWVVDGCIVRARRMGCGHGCMVGCDGAVPLEERRGALHLQPRDREGLLGARDGRSNEQGVRARDCLQGTSASASGSQHQHHHNAPCRPSPRRLHRHTSPHSARCWRITAGVGSALNTDMRTTH